MNGSSLKMMALRLARMRVATAGLELLTMGRGVKVNCAGRWPLRIFWRRRLTHNFRVWEKEFVDVYLRSLLSTDVVYDVGAENGEWAALVGSQIGGENVHLFEPNRPAWRAIRNLWRINSLGAPGGCWRGFVANESTMIPDEPPTVRGWPSISSAERGQVQFEGLHAPNGIPSITIDEYVRIVGCLPTVIKMDIEGAECVAILGAQATLRQARPLVFLSYHPWLVDQFKNVGCDVFLTLRQWEYDCSLISRDHEEHWVFWPREGRRPADFSPVDY